MDQYSKLLPLDIKLKLYKWADESEKEGWSTHQVDPMRKLAGEIDRYLSTGR